MLDQNQPAAVPEQQHSAERTDHLRHWAGQRTHAFVADDRLEVRTRPIGKALFLEWLRARALDLADAQHGFLQMRRDLASEIHDLAIAAAQALQKTAPYAEHRRQHDQRD